MASPGTISKTNAVEVSIHAVTPVSIGVPSEAITEPVAKKSKTAEAIALRLINPFIIYVVKLLICIPGTNIYIKMGYAIKKDIKKYNIPHKNNIK
jgi:hypothetical protein